MSSLKATSHVFDDGDGEPIATYFRHVEQERVNPTTNRKG
jgi:hypothetical protein